MRGQGVVASHGGQEGARGIASFPLSFEFRHQCLANLA